MLAGFDKPPATRLDHLLNTLRREGFDIPVVEDGLLSRAMTAHDDLRTDPLKQQQVYPIRPAE